VTDNLFPDQTALPEIKHPTVRLIALSGYGDIGRNMTIVETKDDMIIIDVGVMFSDPLHPGVDLIISDYTYVAERVAKLRGVFFTHGHEDHIGGAPFFLGEIAQMLEETIPFYGLPLTRSLLSEKIKEHGLTDYVDLVATQSGDVIEAGNLEVEFFSVAHSIPDSAGIIVHTELGALVHTGDFKIDHTPILGQTTDLARLSEIGDSGTFLLCADSTYADVAGYTLPEETIRPVFEQIVSNAPGRIIFATFASLISRIQMIADASVDTDRKIFLNGRSMLRATKFARELGHLDIDENRLLSLDQFKKSSDNRIIIVCTGSQGETNAALTRMANENHPHVSIGRGDTVVLSSNPIPGNETAVSDNINKLTALGASVIHNKVANVHVRGHASAEELKLVQHLVRPEYFLPAQGEYRHLIDHQKLASDVGAYSESMLFGTDGDVFDFMIETNTDTDTSRLRADQVGKIKSDYVFLDRGRKFPTSQEAINERRLLSDNGLLAAFGVFRKSEMKFIETPSVHAYGLDISTDRLTKDLESALSQEIKNYQAANITPEILEHLAEDVLRNLVVEETSMKPNFLINFVIN
jgi:ribonuclease J